MRYWIWWNDIAQGPFDTEELVSLKAFSEELLVCMEDRQDWIPASRIADLSSAIEQVRARRSTPKVPPPPPPRNPPGVRVLQGEFFGESPAQQKLLNTEEKGGGGPYAYYPVQVDIPDDAWIYRTARVTMPIYFPKQPLPQAAVIDLPMPAPQRIAVTPPPVIKESPVRDILEEMSAPDVQEVPIPLTIVETAPVPSPSFDLPSYPAEQGDTQVERNKIRWATWILGPVGLIGVLAFSAYWLMDRASTKSALLEAISTRVPKRRTPAVVVDTASPLPPARAKKALIKKAAPPIKRLPPKVITEVEAPVVVPPPSLPGVKPAVDSWADKQNDAIDFVMNKNVPGTKTSIKTQAKAMLDAMHERELLHAAETGERLYQPDKITWAALREGGSKYRVYLNFMAWQAGGERVQSRSYQFIVDLQTKTLQPEDASTDQDLFHPSADLTLKHNPMAVDIESILGGVDYYNKQKMRAMIVKNSRKNKSESAEISRAMSAAKEKINRAAAYFRKTYSEKALQNIAKAYQFSEILKG